MSIKRKITVKCIKKKLKRTGKIRKQKCKKVIKEADLFVKKLQIYAETSCNYL